MNVPTSTAIIRAKSGRFISTDLQKTVSTLEKTLLTFVFSFSIFVFSKVLSLYTML